MTDRDRRIVLALGIFDGSPRLSGRIEALLRRQRSFVPRVSAARLAAAIAPLLALTVVASLSPRWITFAQRLEFEVASIRPHQGPVTVAGGCGSNGGPGTHDPELYTNNCARLRGLIFEAYGLDYYNEQVAGPGWIDSEPYDVAARIPPGTTKDQFRLMLQGLLAERFDLKVHRESRVFTVYTLVVAKGGPKLTLSSASPDAAHAPYAASNDKDGFPILPPGRPGMAASYSNASSGPVAHWRAQAQTMAAFARMLSVSALNAGRPVIDKTGLDGKYDFTLAYDVPQPGDDGAISVASDPRLSIADAVERQMGLRLIDTKQALDVIVVDRAERFPMEN
jgi:uncharacterized protein (TIGR03435 family)